MNGASLSICKHNGWKRRSVYRSSCFGLSVIYYNGLGYVPYVGSALEEYANAMSVSSVTIPSAKTTYVQSNYIASSPDRILAPNVNFNQAKGHMSYIQQYGYTGSRGAQVKLIGYVTYATYIPSAMGEGYFNPMEP